MVISCCQSAAENVTSFKQFEPKGLHCITDNQSSFIINMYMVVSCCQSASKIASRRWVFAAFVCQDQMLRLLLWVPSVVHVWNQNVGNWSQTEGIFRGCQQQTLIRWQRTCSFSPAHYPNASQSITFQLLCTNCKVLLSSINCWKKPAGYNFS
jgi:hypothetical protein